MKTYGYADTAAPSDKNIFRFYASNFLTDGRCEHAKMKQFTLVAVNIRSQYTLFCKNRWIFDTKLQSRLVTLLN